MSFPVVILGNPWSGAPSVKEYKDKLPAKVAFPAKAITQEAKNKNLKFIKIQTYSENSQLCDPANHMPKTKISINFRVIRLSNSVKS